MALVTKSYRLRAYPNGAQLRMLDRWFGAARWLWNHALAIRSEAYRCIGLKLVGNDVSRMLTQWKRTAGHGWLTEPPATCLTQVLRDQDRAYANFFSKRAKYPRFKPRSPRGSLRFQDVGRAWEKGTLSLPKLGRLQLAEALPEVARPDMVTLIRDAAGRYFVSICAQVEVVALPATGRAVGVDLGIKHLATLSTGKKEPASRHYASRLRYLRRMQQCLSRRQKGSHRRDKQKRRVARAHARVADQRSYALHKLTTTLVREFDVIVIEDLNVKGLARGRLSRSIHDASFGEFRRQLTYKAALYGRTLIACDRFFASSKTCSACDYELAELRLDVREWTCPKCGTEHDRDVNAAKNLLNAGLRQLTRGEPRGVLGEPGGTCPTERWAQVPGEEPRSGQWRVREMERAYVH